jgi:CHAT domain-containing protein
MEHSSPLQRERSALSRRHSLPEDYEVICTRRAGATLLTVGVLSVAAYALFLSACRERQERLARREELLEALRPFRPVMGRVSGVAYAVYPTPLPKLLPSLRKHLLREAARQIAHELALHPSASALEDRALLELSAGKLAAAVVTLESATRLVPRDAQLQSDLCALELELGEFSDPQYYLSALGRAHAAVEIMPTLLPAWFNLALALEQNGLIEKAKSTWRHYLDSDPSSPWAAEARRHLSKLQEPDDSHRWAQLSPFIAVTGARSEQSFLTRLSRQFPALARKYGEDDLLARWAEAYLAGKPEAASATLDIAREFGDALALASREPMAKDAVDAIDRRQRSTEAGGQSRLLSLAHAQQDLTIGQELCLNQAIGGPARLELARKAFVRAGSPLKARASYDLAVCAYEHARYPEALRRVKTLLNQRGINRYRSLVAKAHCIEGLCYISTGRPNLSLRAYREAEAIFRTIGSNSERGYVADLLSENLRYLGERESSLRLLFTAATAAVKSGESRALYRAFDSLAEEAQRRGLGNAALDFRDEVLRVAEVAPERQDLQQAGLAHARLRRGEARLEIGDLSGSSEDLDVAAKNVRQITDPDARRLREADLLLAQGKLLLSTDPRSAIGLLSKAVTAKLKVQSLFFLLEAFYLRARAELAVGDRKAALADVTAGLWQFERQRREVISLTLRASYLERVENLFDLAITLASSQSDGSAVALAFAERQRARTLLDLAGSPLTSAENSGREPDARSPLPAASLLRRLPTGVALVEYAVLPDSALIWVLRRDSELTMAESRISAGELAALVLRLRLSLDVHNPGVDSESVSAALFNALLNPVLNSVRGSDVLVFVPDKDLREVPFSALRNPRTGRYLIQDHAVAVAPSASLYLAALEKDRALTHESGIDALILGDPRFDPRLFPNLPALPGSASEAIAVGKIYGDRADLRLELAATKRAVLEEAGKHRVVHIASHALADHDFPSLSRLVLAPTVGVDEGILYAHEIERHRFPRTRLMVLAACGTGRTGSELRDGAEGLAWAFLGAGVPAVVASLWNIDDLSAGRLLTEFHHRFRETGDPLNALRDTQLSLLYGPDSAFHSPAVWASFELAGGLANSL